MRQIDLLKDTYDLTVVGYGETPYKELNYIKLSPQKKSYPHKVFNASLLVGRFFEHFYWSDFSVKFTLKSLLHKKFDCVIANDINTLPLALKISMNRPVFLDSHEYTPKEFEDRFLWRLLFTKYYEYICKKYLSKVSAMSTVCQGIANEYQKNFSVEPIVVLNAPEYKELSPAKVEKNTIRLIHHGAAITSRKIELMIEMLQYLDSRFTLDLMLVDNSPGYLSALKKIAHNNPRVRFREPVAMKFISTEINNYDIGIFLLPPVNLNYKFALPNKFFEFIQARLAIAIGPSEEMASIVTQYGIGVISNDFSPKHMAMALNDLSSEQIANMKNASAKAARELNAHSAKKLILSTVQRLIAGNDKC